MWEEDPSYYRSMAISLSRNIQFGDFLELIQDRKENVKSQCMSGTLERVEDYKSLTGEYKGLEYTYSLVREILEQTTEESN